MNEMQLTSCKTMNILHLKVGYVLDQRKNKLIHSSDTR